MALCSECRRFKNGNPRMLSAKLKDDERPIAVFDSGIGGISILKTLQAQLPNERFLYLADRAFVPYGKLTDSQIIERSKTITDYFVGKNAKAIVVACNTATAAAIVALRGYCSLPIFGTEPAIKPAATSSKKNHIAVLATSSTINSNQFSYLVEEYASEKKILGIEAPELVRLVESGDWKSEQCKQEIISLLAPVIDRIDTLILGCTHFIYLKPLLTQIFGSELNLIDTGLPIANWVKVSLKRDNLLVVDNNSSDVSGELFSDFPCVEVVTTTESLEGDKTISNLLPNATLSTIKL